MWDGARFGEGAELVLFLLSGVRDRGASAAAIEPPGVVGAQERPVGLHAALAQWSQAVRACVLEDFPRSRFVVLPDDQVLPQQLHRVRFFGVEKLRNRDRIPVLVEIEWRIIR